MSILIITIPLLSSFSIFLFGRFLGQKGSEILSISTMGIIMLLGIKLLYGFLRWNKESEINLIDWINIGLIKISFSFIFDKYSIFMIFLISSISFLVLSYSCWYMFYDPHKNRFLALLLLFTVSMLILVSSSNLLLLFLGWESVGILSYLLINFWYFSINSNKSAIKAILYNKIGDIGLIIAMSIILLKFGNLNIYSLSFIAYNNDIWFHSLLFAFLIGAVAKSAQIFLHPWLGDAMAGPTPVSALLHAATMVTAGVFLLFRLESLIGESNVIRSTIIIIGLTTIIFGGLSSINQNDIKKIIAYSTSSQLGYMFLTNGLLLPDLGLFHLITHGFFKALLFLTAGILIHNFNGEQDIRKFGAFIYKFPISYIFILIGSLSILSFPFLAGFYSKEAILESAFAPQFPLFLYLLMILGAIFTSIYSYKLLYYTFFSSPNYNYSLKKSISEIGISLTYVLSILIIGAIFIGYLTKDYFLGTLINNDIEYLPFYIKLLPVILSILIFPFSLIEFKPIFSDSWNFINLIKIKVLTTLNKRLFIDSIFNSLLVAPLLTFGYKLTYKLLDKGLFEYFGPLGFIRIFYSFPFFFSKYFNSLPHLSIYSTSDKTGQSNLFIYLFITIFIFFILILI